LINNAATTRKSACTGGPGQRGGRASWRRRGLKDIRRRSKRELPRGVHRQQ
jgi:hypothetical protein